MANATRQSHDLDGPDHHYLKQELNSLLQRRGDINEFLSRGKLDGISYWDLENPNDKWMSPTFWRTLGYEPETMPHKAAAWQSLIHPDDFKSATKHFRKHCADPDHAYDQITRYKHAEGRTVWMQCRGMAIRDNWGQPVRMLGAYLNVTDDKAGILHRSEIYTVQPESHHQVLQKLSTVVLHDLKTSLRQMTMIMTALEGELANTEETCPAALKAVDSMNAALNHTRRIAKYLHELFSADQP